VGNNFANLLTKERNERGMVGLLRTDSIEQGLQACLALGKDVGAEIPC
jgi:hypothetical protein